MSKNKKKRKKLGVQIERPQKPLDSARYVCVECGAEEERPGKVTIYFDELYPDQVMYGPNQIKCEKCGNGIMRPLGGSAKIVRGYGIFEGLSES
ncbi:MAG: hypothetical protein P4L69_06810 [Desulfosporosinus sp.]|nr:hypothetical protein [Desulfosporosinus sp.]